MAQSLLVIADSGTGKSTSIRTLKPEETFIINIANKPLPFKGYKSKYTQISKDNPKGNLTSTATAPGIIKAINHVDQKMGHIKTIVVDDGECIQTFCRLGSFTLVKVLLDTSVLSLVREMIGI